MPRQMHLMAYLKTGPTAMHSGAWRHPQSDLHDIFTPSRYAHIARVLEDARFDGCFYADTQGIPDLYQGSFRAYLQYGGQLSYLDPLTILPIMAAATRASRAWRHPVDDVPPSVPSGPHARLARHAVRRPGLLEYRHLQHRFRGAQLRPAGAAGQGIALRPWR